MKKTTKPQPQTRPPVDREGVRVLAIELGAREAARRLNLNPNTVLSWARRYDWKLPDRRDIGRPAINPSALSLQSGDVLLDEHKRLEGQTKTALMQTTAKAATHAAQKPPLDVSNTSQLRDLAQSAVRIFGWDKPLSGPVVQFNQVCISQEQLEQIRQLRAVPEPDSGVNALLGGAFNGP
jgi:hypothetical protein